MVRLFIAVMVPQNLKDALVLVQNRIKKFVDGKFVEKENIHISVSFFGDVDDSEIDGLKQKLDSICSQRGGFQVGLSRLKFIPSLNKLRVVAIDAESKELHELSDEIKMKIGGDVKPPHLTLCRVKNVADGRGLSAVAIGPLVFDVDRISIVKSQLSLDGPVYTVIHESRLK